MITDKQNRIDLLRMAEKRAAATRLLKEWKAWHRETDGSESTTLLVLTLGMLRTIERGTEKDVNYLIDTLEDRNQKALMKKLSS